jgi:hypothetical protein
MDKLNNTIELVNVAAGGASDATTYYYVSMKEYDKGAIQATIAGSGTVTVTVEGSIYPLAYSTANPSTLTYVDISSAILGAVSKTASFLATDSTGILGCLNYYRVKVVVAGSDATTAYAIYALRAEV